MQTIEREREEYARVLGMGTPASTWGSFVEALDGVDSSFGTASLIGSVLRDFNSPDSQPNTGAHLEAFKRMCQTKIDTLNQKMDFLISMVTPQPAPVVSEPSTPPACQVRTPVEATMTMTMSSPAESEQNDIFDPVGPLTTEKLIILKTYAKSRANFAVLLLKELFDPKELEGKNITGVHGKEMVDPERIEIIKNVVQRFNPVPVADADSCWRTCCKAMDEYLRRPASRRNINVIIF